MKMRYAILILFTTFLFGPVCGAIVMLLRLEFNRYQLGPAIVWLSILSFLALLVCCARAVENHPDLVRGVLLGIFAVFLLLIPLLALPAIT